MDEIPEIHIKDKKDELFYLNEYRYNIHKKMIEIIEHAFDNDLEVVPVLKIIHDIENYSMFLTIEKDQWEEGLEKARLYFEEKEDYELCEKTNKLIKKIKHGDT
tara:strand:+ start:105 stop:416 length:312 start_codon:yes stop_codon:yes gene_type:complete